MLSKEEAERAPSLTQVLSGGVGITVRGPGGRAGGNTPAPTLDALDTDKDGKVTLIELSAYYRKNGLQPFQFQFTQPANPFGVLVLGGMRGDPPADAVGKKVFSLLDTNGDGKLSKEELTAAADVLLRLDENEDQIVTPRELAPNATPDGTNALMSMIAGPGKKDVATSNKDLVPVLTPGEVPADLVRRLQERYGPKVDKTEEKKLIRKDLGLDKATFARLDADKDGLLDSQELAGFVKRTPDLELAVRLGKNETQDRLVVLGGEKSPLTSRVRSNAGVVSVDLGLSRVDLHGGEEDQRPDPFGNLIRQQYLANFAQSDKDNNGYLDEKEANASRQFRNTFKAMDRDGDGKLYEKEVTAYFEQYQKLQAQAQASCVTLVFSDQSRGLFDLLDANRDGRLSMRELRQAPKLLELDRAGKGHLTTADVPRGYQLTLRRGPVTTGVNDRAAFFKLYAGYGEGETDYGPQAGPVWFRKMDRNRDGDVSRKEFLGSDEEFRQIDTDGDGLISLEEATKADQRFRKVKN